jgi:peptide/nickel transport system substrate-binding protein
MSKRKSLRLNRREFIQWSSMATGGALLAACAPSAAPGAAPAGEGSAAARTDLRVALSAEPGFMNPVMVTSDRSFSKIGWQVYDSLVVYDYETNTVKPQLATDWQQKDELTWEFKLREGVQFHKGYGELTAEDVEFMVNYVVNENKPLKFLYFFVEGATATDKYTVEYKLSQPFAPFLFTTARDRAAMIVSKKAYEEMGEEAFNRNPVGTGAFEMSEWRSGDSVTLTRHADYWGAPLPKLDEISFRFITDTITRESLLKSGEVDFIDGPDYKNVADWQADENFVVTSTPSWGTDWIPFSVTVPPFDKVEVRQAICYAIDRESLVENIYYGNAQADQGPLPAGYIGYPSPEIYPLNGDKEKAKELLAAAGLPDGFSTTVLTRAEFKPLAEAISGQLAEIGIQMTIETLDPGTLNARTRELDFEATVTNLAFMTPDTDSTMYWFYHTDTVGNYGYNNPTIDQQLEIARLTQEPEARSEIYQEILSTVLDEAPYCYLLHPNIVRIYRKGLEGIPIVPQDTVMLLNEATWTS